MSPAELISPGGGVFSIPTVLARCCCLSLCRTHGGLFSLVDDPSFLSVGTLFRGLASTGGGEERELMLSDLSLWVWICFACRINSGTSSSPVSFGSSSFSDVGLRVLRSWLAQGTMWVSSLCCWRASRSRRADVSF